MDSVDRQWPAALSQLEPTTGLRALFTRSRSGQEHRFARPRSTIRPGHQSLQQPGRDSFTVARDIFTSPPSPRTPIDSGFRLGSDPRRLRPSFRRATSWDPPPVFQAYPQSIVHAILPASCLSSESILKHGHLRRGSNAEDLVRELLGESSAAEIKAQSENRKKSKHQRRMSASIGAGGWTRKLFVLLTTGWLLQYAAEGHHDRLPEKVLQLGKDSVAFASDAIPGRHWVLQVTSDPDNDIETKDIANQGKWPRFALRPTEIRRVARTLLLVFEDQNEFGSWMSIVRREIEALGGIHYCPEASTEHGQAADLGPSISSRFQIQRNRYQFSQPHLNSPSDVCVCDHVNGNCNSKPTVGHNAPARSHPPSAHSNAASSIMTSNDLEPLRSSDASSLSTATATRISSEGSITSTSPLHNQFNKTQSHPPAVFDELSCLPARLQNLQVSILPQSRLPPADTSFNPRHLLQPVSTDPFKREDPLRPSSTCVTSGHAVAGADVNPLDSHNRFSQCSTSVESSSGSAISEKREINEPQPPLGNKKPTKGRPMSSLAPLPSIRRSSQRRQVHTSLDDVLSQNRCPENSSPESKANAAPSRPVSSHTRASPSTAGYVLFPKRYSSTENTSPQSTPPSPPPERDLPHPPEQNDTQKQTASTLKSPSTMPTTLGARRTRKPASMHLRLKKLRDDHSVPERSPAVTDAHFATCFGTQSPFLHDCEISREPEQMVMTAAPIGATLIGTVVVTSNLPLSPPRAGSKPIPRRSTSRLSAPAALIVPPPTSPPPTCPLPAVPGVRESRRESKTIDVFEYHPEFVSRRAALGHCKTDAMLSTCWTATRRNEPLS